MAAAAIRAGRSPSAVDLLVVTKYAPIEAVREVLASGLVRQAAENRVQDAARRKSELGPLADTASWRMIGHLQTNKAKQALECFDAIDSIDSVRLAETLDRKLADAGKTLPALVQVKLTDKDSQSGVAPGELEPLLKQLERFPRLKIEGLMGIAPDLEPAEAVRPHFKRLKKLFDERFAGRPGARLSMGMSRDFEVAIEEGSTMVRVGSAIFQSVSQKQQ